MKISATAKGLVAKLYTAYGTYSGYLLGLSPEHRPAVEIIVQFVLDLIEVPGNALDRVDR